MVGVSKPYLWGLEKGRNDNPTLEFLQRMASHYGIAVAEIIEPSRQDIEEDAYFWSLFNAVKPLDDDKREILLEMAKTMHKIHKKKKEKNRHQ
jgi:transcriptional regulator with XRE-family HTH domain